MQFTKFSVPVLAAAAAVLLASCGQEPEDEEITPEALKPAVAAPEPEEVIPLNIGDVEQTIELRADIAPESQADNIAVERMESDMKRLKVLTLDVSPPYPEKLLLNYTAKSKQGWEENPVAVRAKVLLDREEVIDSFSLVLDGDAQRNTFMKQVDVMAALDGIPETAGITLDPTAVLMPEGTDPASVDPETADSEERSGAIYHTAVRINFLKNGEQ